MYAVVVVVAHILGVYAHTLVAQRCVYVDEFVRFEKFTCIFCVR